MFSFLCSSGHIGQVADFWNYAVYWVWDGTSWILLCQTPVDRLEREFRSPRSNANVDCRGSNVYVFPRYGQWVAMRNSYWDGRTWVIGFDNYSPPYRERAY